MLHGVALTTASAIKEDWWEDIETVTVRASLYSVSTHGLGKRLCIATPTLTSPLMFVALGRQTGELAASQLPARLARRPLKTRSNLLSLWQTTRLYLESDRLKQNFELATDPFETLEVMFSLLRRRSHLAEPPDILDCIALIWIGFAIHGISTMVLCSLCFRWALPGQTLCPLHGQSIAYSGTRSAKALGYSRGAKTAIRYQRPWVRVPGRIVMSKKRALVLAAHIQATAVIPDLKRTVHAILKRIQQSPRVLEQLGKVPEDPPKLYNHLRKHVDPLEHNPSCWTWKIRQYELWLAAEKKAFPGVRGKSKKTGWQIMEASKYARAGRSKVATARLLGISPSTISNWIARGLMDADIWN